ncbi:PP2A regulatory subunit tap46-like [Castilleja foliolosa]|uniref:PP2A regulatory subunit tap46-like n=1 Tax=Castilleja foliolosa TaxID=1961234 RepID=A0ABD3DTN8_9LAMI
MLFLLPNFFGSPSSTYHCSVRLSLSGSAEEESAALRPPAPPLEWSVRNRWSGHVSSNIYPKRQAQRLSPTTPLSWSGATSLSGGSGGAGDEGSRRDLGQKWAPSDEIESEVAGGEIRSDAKNFILVASLVLVPIQRRFIVISVILGFTWPYPQEFLSFCEVMELMPKEELESSQAMSDTSADQRAKKAAALSTPVEAGEEDVEDDDGDEEREAWLTTISLALCKV